MATTNDTRMPVGTDGTGGTKLRAMGEEEIIRLVNETAEVLLDEQELKTEMDIWVRRGKVIRDYVRKLQPDGKHHEPNPYILLADHPDIRWSTDQLRNYVDAIELWEQIGDGQPSLPVTFYAIVASLKGGIKEKQALLRKILDDHLTTREVKREAAASRKGGKACDEPGTDGVPGDEATAAGKPKGDWRKVGACAEKLYGELSGVSAADLPDPAVVCRLKEVAARINDLVASLDRTPGK